MQLVEFLQDFQGWKAGKCQYFTEEEAKRLFENGLAKDPYKKTIVEKVVTAAKQRPPKVGDDRVKDAEYIDLEREQANKAPDKPKKDKMIHSPVKKK